MNCDDINTTKEEQQVESSESLNINSISPVNVERFLLFCFIAINAYIGSFIRYGMNYYKIWHTETNYTIMYTQILGCFIMGFILQHRSFLIIHSKSRFCRILYTAISSGLCGTITTFSSWAMVCNNNFYLQWDVTSFNNYIGTYNGGRFFEWITCMMTGVAVPLMALHFGQFVALLTPYNEDQVTIQIELAKTSLHALEASNSSISSSAIDKSNSYISPAVKVLKESLEQVISSDEKDAIDEVFVDSSNVLPVNDNVDKNNSNSNDNNNTSKDRSHKSTNYFITDESPLLEVMMVFIFLISTVLVIVLPTVVYPTWINIMYVGVTGVAGAYLRYSLSGYNSYWPNFPLGTFIANISGTWFLALLTVLSKYVVDYYDTDVQSVLMGLSLGFCGCLTTVSTFVSEVDKLPRKDSYIYGITTELTAQFGILIILNLYSYSTIPTSTLGIQNQPTNFCLASQELCTTFLANINCSTDYQINKACGNNNDYNTFLGECACGNFSTTRNSIKLIDALIKSNTSTILSAWPTKPWANAAPTEVIDYCVSYQNMCNFFMIQIGCPLHQRHISACDRKGILHAQNTCTCGTLSLADTELQVLISTYTLDKRYDMIPYQGFITQQNGINFCEAYADVCNKLLDHLQAPKNERINIGSSSAGDLSTFTGECSVGDFDVSSTVGNHIYDVIVSPNMDGLSVTYLNASVSNNSSGVWDACSSYHSICMFFLDKIACPSDLRVIQPCSINPSDDITYYPYGKPENMIGECICGTMNYASQRTRQLFVDELIAERTAKDYLYLPFSNDPWTVSVSSNAFKQLYYPEETVPNV